MKTNFKTPQFMLVSLLFAAIVIAGILFQSKRVANKNLDNERLKNEKLLSEKNKLDETVLNLKNQFEALKGKNKELDKVIAENKKILHGKEMEIKRILADNNSASSLKKKIAELEALQVKLNKEIDQLNFSHDAVKKENLRLNELLSSARNENEILEINNAVLKAMVADNYRVEALRGKHDKLTINARRTDKLIVSFELPAETTNGLYFKVIDPKGNEFSSKTSKEAHININNNNDLLLASTEQTAGKINTKRTELIYHPKSRMEKGVYIIKIYNNNDYLGSTQLRLR